MNTTYWPRGAGIKGGSHFAASQRLRLNREVTFIGRSLAPIVNINVSQAGQKVLNMIDFSVFMNATYHDQT